MKAIDYEELREIFATLFAKGFTETDLINEIRRVSARLALEDMKKNT